MKNLTVRDVSNPDIHFVGSKNVGKCRAVRNGPNFTSQFKFPTARGEAALLGARLLSAERMRARPMNCTFGGNGALMQA